jgi:hypothetical protein
MRWWLVSSLAASPRFRMAAATAHQVAPPPLLGQSERPVHRRSATRYTELTTRRFKDFWERED